MTPPTRTVISFCACLLACTLAGCGPAKVIIPDKPPAAPDTDKDGVADQEDNCPTDVNSDQLDVDGDGFGDLCDPDIDGDRFVNEEDWCPQLAESAQADTDGDGLGDACDPDLDGDGIPNEGDWCPNVAESPQLDTDGDGIGDACDPDWDGDAIPNDEDTCPVAYDPDQRDLDGDTWGDACDSDMDGDNIDNPVDNCPAVANPDQADLDGDRIGDVCDTQLDLCGDGVVTGQEQCEQGSQPPSCTAYGYTSGSIRCQSCRWDFSQCWNDKRVVPDDLYRRRGRGSCPYAFLWNGETYDYYTDLSGSVLGYGIPFFAPEFYGLNVYELGNFREHDGVFRMKLREVIYEASYVDELALLVVDVPEGHDAFNTWSFTSQIGEHPTTDFVTVSSPRPPLSATNDAGVDVTDEIARADGSPVPVADDQLSRVVVDFGPLEHPERARLLITAWGNYADYAGKQDPPYSGGIQIETPGPDGAWVTRKVAGKAAGDARTWAIDLAGILQDTESGKMRITLAHQPTVLGVLDALAIDDTPPVELQVTRVTPNLAELRFGGAAPVDPSTLEHRIHAVDKALPIIPAALLSGNFTRYGDVLPLLDTPADDRFAIMAHGDELALEYDAPPQPAGTTRRVFLAADVFYTLKNHPYGQLTDTIEPLPFHGMKKYPYEPEAWPYQGDDAYQEYLDTWNTRRIEAPAVPES